MAVGVRSAHWTRRVPRLAAELAVLQLTYPQGCRWLSLWCGSPYILTHFYPAETALFQRWAESLPERPEKAADALSACILSNILWSTRFKRTVPFLEEGTFLDAMRRSSARFHRDLSKIIDRTPLERMVRFFRIAGLEHLHTARRPGNGVILVSYHGSTNRFANAVLPRYLDGRPIPTLSLTHGMQLARKVRPGGKRYWRLNEGSILANVAVEAQRLLREGGIVQVIPDIGYDASRGVPLTIGGHRYLVRPGFADLAVTAGAVVVPFFSTRRPDGRIDMRLLPPLDPGPPSADRSIRVNGLLRQYGSFVEKAWNLAPESLLWEVIDGHMHRPLADGG